MSAEFRKQLEKPHKVIVAVFFAVVLTVLALLWVSNMSLGIASLVDGRATAAFRAIVWLIVSGEIFFLFWWKKQLISREVIFNRAQKMKLIPNFVKGAESAQEQALGKTVSFYFFGNVLALAVSESIGLFGFFLAYLAAYYRDQYLLTAVSLMFLIMFYPSRSFFARLIDSESK